MDRVLLIDKVDNELDHHLFLLRIRLSNEKCESRESCLIDLHFTILAESVTILLEEPDEEECSDTLVPISEGVILDDEVEEMCRLLLDRRIEILSVEGRDDTREYPDEARILLIPEEGSGF